MIFLVGRHLVRDLLEVELTRQAVAYRVADSLRDIPFTVSMNVAGATRVTLGTGESAIAFGPGDAVANFLTFPGLETDDFSDTEQWAAWWALLDASGCRVWNGPSRMGFPAPAEDLVFAALLRDGGWMIPVLEATIGELDVSPGAPGVALRDIVTGVTPNSARANGIGVVRRTLVDPQSSRHLLWVAGRMTDMATNCDHLGDTALLEAMAPVSALLSRHAVGAALLIVQQDAECTPGLLAVQPAMYDARFEHKREFATRAIASFLTA